MKNQDEGAGREGLRAGSAAYGALVLRVALGVVFVAHAMVKAVGLTFPVAAMFFAEHGFPGWSVYPVFVVELLGGGLLVLGVATRAVSVLPLAVLVGAFRVHVPNGWYFAAPHGGWEYLAVLAAGLVGVILLGPGAWRLGRRAAI
jgi:putative oxidoreductase